MKSQSHQKLSPTTVTIASTIGATIEWYDFFLYGVVTPIVLNKLFFPSYDPAVGIALAYATFAIGFIARPVGGLIFGHYGDRIGRKQMLIVTILIMGLSTFAIGFVPSHESIGFWAPCNPHRIASPAGYRAGRRMGRRGSYGRRACASWKKGLLRCLAASWSPRGLNFKCRRRRPSVANAGSAFPHWGWRIAFWLSGMLIVIGIYIHAWKSSKPRNSCNARANQKLVQLPAVELLRREPKHVLLGMGARYIEGAWFNLFGVFMISYLTNNLHATCALLH